MFRKIKPHLEQYKLIPIFKNLYKIIIFQFRNSKKKKIKRPIRVVHLNPIEYEDSELSAQRWNEHRIPQKPTTIQGGLRRVYNQLRGLKKLDTKKK